MSTQQNINRTNTPDRSEEEIRANALLERARSQLPNLATLPEISKTTAAAITVLAGAIARRKQTKPAIAKALSKADEGIRSGAKVAGERIRGNLEDVLRAETRFRLNAEQEVRTQVLGLLTTTANEAAFLIESTLQEHDAAIERATRHATDYLESSTNSPLPQAIAEANLRTEIESTGLRVLLPRVQSALRTNDLDEADRFLRIAKPLILATIKTPKNKIAERLGLDSSPGTVDKEVEAAFSLRNVLERRISERRPQALIVAINVRDFCLAPAFVLICGVNANWLTKQEFSALMNGGRPAVRRWEVDPKWFLRDTESAVWTRS